MVNRLDAENRAERAWNIGVGRLDQARRSSGRSLGESLAVQCPDPDEWLRLRTVEALRTDRTPNVSAAVVAVLKGAEVSELAKLRLRARYAELEH
jgi:hypothetical protein